MARCIRLLVIAVLIVLFWGSAIAEETSGPLLLILDASGSMWGQLDGQHKNVIAKEALGEIIPGLPDHLNVGLITYGHRRKGDCDDDPCGVVADLKDGGIDFVMHVVGFDVTAEEREELECLARAGGGSYFAAASAGDFRLAAEAATQTEEEPPASGDGKVNDQYDLDYVYLGGKGSSGTVTMTVPDGAGSYDFRLMDYGSGGNELASVAFTVQ